MESKALCPSETLGREGRMAPNAPDYFPVLLLTVGAAGYELLLTALIFSVSSGPHGADLTVYSRTQLLSRAFVSCLVGW